MNLRDYLRVLRTHWRLIISFTLVGLGAAASLVLTATPKYQASIQLFVSAKDSADISGALQGSQFSQQRVKSYAGLVNKLPVTTAVVRELGLSLTPRQVADEISASAPLDTVLINVRVLDTSPTRARDIANEVGVQFGALVNELETPQGSRTSPVKVSVVEPAELPVDPASPQKALLLSLGFVIGLAVGIGAAVVRESLDTTVKHFDEFGAELGVSPLGVVLYDPDASKRPLIVHEAAQSTRAEAFRQLRTNLQFVDVDRDPRSIVVTSSLPGEGKTTTTANLALTLAQAGVRVCLVESDLRRPKLAQYLGLEGAVGLTNVLIGRAQLDDVLQPWGDQGLHVLASGPTPPNPSELLGAQAMADTLTELERRFDLVLIDAPPLLPVTDAAILANLTSGVMLVVRYGKTKKEQIRRAVESLRAVDARIYGIVINMAPRKGPEAYYYGYAYRYEYRPRDSAPLLPASRSAQRAATVTPQPGEQSARFTPATSAEPTAPAVPSTDVH